MPDGAGEILEKKSISDRGYHQNGSWSVSKNAFMAYFCSRKILCFAQEDAIIRERIAGLEFVSPIRKENGILWRF